MPQLFNNRKQKFTFLLLLFYAAVVFMFDADETKIRYIYIAYGMLVINLFIRAGGFIIFKETKYLIGYLVFSVFSLVWSYNTHTSFVKVKGVLLLLIFLVLLTSYVFRTKLILSLVVALGIGSVALSIYMTMLYGGFSGMAAALNTSARIGWEINNVNAIGNSFAIGMVAVVGIALLYKKRIMYLLLIPMGMCLLSAGSRMSTLSLFAGISVLILLLSKAEGNSVSSFSRIFLILCVLVAVLIAIRNLPAVHELVMRIENAFIVLTGGQPILKENSVQTRSEYVRLGWQQFLKSPLWGNGIGCAGYAMLKEYGYVTYLHNNYMEILASGGLIGFFLFYTPYFLVLKNHVRRIFRYHEHNPVLFISFALLITKLIGHVGTVVYYSKIEFLLLAIWISTVHEGDDYYLNVQR